MNEKRGMSAILATVLIILITVAAVAIIWAVVIPILKSNISADFVVPSLKIDNSKGFTYWDEQREVFCVQYKRSITDSDENPPTGAEIIFLVDGNSQKAFLGPGDIPTPGNSLSKCFNLTGYGKPEEIAMASKQDVGAESKTNPPSSKVFATDIKEGICSTDCDTLSCIGDGCGGPPGAGPPTTEFICDNSVDDDGDGATDCADTDCAANPVCTLVEDCTNGADDDGDTWADCLDDDCFLDAACLNPISASTCAEIITTCQNAGGSSCASRWSPTRTGDPTVCSESNQEPILACSDELNYADAKAFCENIGTRLCTFAEYSNPTYEALNTGCSFGGTNYDYLNVWTSSSVSASPSITCNAGEKITFNQGSLSAQCASVTTSAPVRCCADA